MPVGIYLTDMTAEQWARELGQVGNQILNSLANMNNLKLGWDVYKAGRTDVEIAIAWGKTIGSGTAQSGTATTIKLAAGHTEADDFFNGFRLRCTEGTGAGQEADITDWDLASKDATVASWPTATPDGTTKYVIASKFSADVDTAMIDGNKIRRVSLGNIALTPADDLLLFLRKFV